MPTQTTYADQYEAGADGRYTKAIAPRSADATSPVNTLGQTAALFAATGLAPVMSNTAASPTSSAPSPISTRSAPTSFTTSTTTTAQTSLAPTMPSTQYSSPATGPAITTIVAPILAGCLLGALTAIATYITYRRRRKPGQTFRSWLSPVSPGRGRDPTETNTTLQDAVPEPKDVEAMAEDARTASPEMSSTSSPTPFTTARSDSSREGKLRRAATMPRPPPYASSEGLGPQYPLMTASLPRHRGGAVPRSILKRPPPVPAMPMPAMPMQDDTKTHAGDGSDIRAPLTRSATTPGLLERAHGRRQALDLDRPDGIDSVAHVQSGIRATMLHGQETHDAVHPGYRVRWADGSAAAPSTPPAEPSPSQLVRAEMPSGPPGPAPLQRRKSVTFGADMIRLLGGVRAAGELEGAEGELDVELDVELEEEGEEGEVAADKQARLGGGGGGVADGADAGEDEDEDDWETIDGEFG